MDKNFQSQMLSTKSFIMQKCTKDHFMMQMPSLVKHSSVYGSDYSRKREENKENGENPANHAKSYNKRQTGKVVDIIDQSIFKKSAVFEKGEHIANLQSVYQNSFQKKELSKPQKYILQPSYFLKPQAYQPYQSINTRYQKVARNVSQQSQIFKIEKGQPRTGNLSVPKYNRMSTHSLYKDSYENFSKFPSVYQKGRDSELKMGQQADAGERKRKQFL